MELRETGEVMGFCGISPVMNLNPPFPIGTMEIGWRLATRFWGTVMSPKPRNRCSSWLSMKGDAGNRLLRRPPQPSFDGGHGAHRLEA